MFSGYRSARYYIVSCGSRIAVSAVAFSGLFRPSGPIGNKTGKRASPEGTAHDLVILLFVFFATFSIFFCLFGVVFEVDICQDVYNCCKPSGVPGM